MDLRVRICKFLKKEVVLCVAFVLAVISSFLIHPDKKYIQYIDFRTLAILFSLMSVMAGLKLHGAFDFVGRKMLEKTKYLWQVILTLVLLTFFGSMLITNDVALITFVPFTFVVFNLLGESYRKKQVLWVVCIQTIAANLGSMLTPLGNPQNLYLYGKSGLSFGRFLLLMLPYTLTALALLCIWSFLLCVKEKKKVIQMEWKSEEQVFCNWKKIRVYLILFGICLLAVLHIIDYRISFLIVLLLIFLWDRKSLKRVDYSLLLTFVAFFIFIGNAGRISAFSLWLNQIIEGREVIVAVLASQIISNVPIALLLSGFTNKISLLIIGTNLGGFGTLIASMASLISYRQIAQEETERKGKYFLIFTISNVIFLLILLGVWKMTGVQ